MSGQQTESSSVIATSGPTALQERYKCIFGNITGFREF